MQRHPLTNGLAGGAREIWRWAGGLGLAGWLALAPVCAASPLEHARRAQVLLGEERWSQVVRIENTNRASVYPREVFALVFELGGLLWFYTDTDGTQSLSLRRNELAVDKRELPRLLRAIDPGFHRHEVVPRPAVREPGLMRGHLPNGCLIESYAQLRARLAAGEAIARARLLNVYYRASGERSGHTVLAYETPSGTYVFDPARPAFRRRVRASLRADALAVGRAVQWPFVVTDARWVPTTIPRLSRGIALRPPFPSFGRRTVCDS